ncbi:DUF6916 family protein [Chloroflexota bacterium]
MIENLKNLEASYFTDYLNQSFSITTDSGEQVEAELSQVTAIETHQAAASQEKRRQPFSIVFTGPMQPVLPQGIYLLKHEKLEPLSLFIVPISPDEKGMRYEAVFN